MGSFLMRCSQSGVLLKENSKVQLVFLSTKYVSNDSSEDDLLALSAANFHQAQVVASMPGTAHDYAIFDPDYAEDIKNLVDAIAQMAPMITSLKSEFAGDDDEEDDDSANIVLDWDAEDYFDGERLPLLSLISHFKNLENPSEHAYFNFFKAFCHVASSEGILITNHKTQENYLLYLAVYHKPVFSLFNKLSHTYKNSTDYAKTQVKNKEPVNPLFAYEGIVACMRESSDMYNTYHKAQYPFFMGLRACVPGYGGQDYSDTVFSAQKQLTVLTNEETNL